MTSIAVSRYALTVVACAAGVGLFPACGGGEGAGATPEPQAQASPAPALEGSRVSGREEALQIVARGVVAPLHGSELAHAVLARSFELRGAHADGALPPASPGDRWTLAPDAQAPGGGGAMLEGPVAIDIEAADNAEGLMLRGEAGFVRALLRFEQVGLGAATHIDGAIALEVSRTAAGAGSARRSQADLLSITEGNRTLNWSYLFVEVDAQQVVQTLNVVSDAPIDGSDRVWLDVTTSSAPDRPGAAAAAADSPSRRYVATGVIGFLRARLTLQVAADGGWTIEVDNDKDDRVDFVVRSSADEARALMLGL